MTGIIKNQLVSTFLYCQAQFVEQNPWSKVAYEGNCEEYLNYLSKLKTAEEKGIPTGKGNYSGSVCQKFYFWERCQAFENISAKEMFKLFNQALGKLT